MDDFTYFLASHEVEKAFEHLLNQELQVEYMGDDAWFLGCYYTWQKTEDGRLTVSVTQTAKIESLLEEHKMDDCNSVPTPYRAGVVIDQLPHDDVPPDNKPHLVKPYQQLLGGLNWLSLNTRPDLTVLVSLLSSHLRNPSASHMTAAKHVLAWLSGTRNHGIGFTQGGSFAKGLVSWVGRTEEEITALAQTWIDANWGPQDASHPKPGRPAIHNKRRSPISIGPLRHAHGWPISMGLPP